MMNFFFFFFFFFLIGWLVGRVGERGFVVGRRVWSMEFVCGSRLIEDSEIFYIDF